MKVYKKYFTTVALGWSVCFTVFVFCYMLFLAPQRSERKQMANKVAEKRQRYEAVTKVAQEENRIRVKEEIERLRDRLANFVVDFEKLADLTFDISKIASEKRVAAFSIKSKDTGALAPIQNCKYICEGRIEIGFAAGFNQFAAFLNALERHRPVLFVDNFTVNQPRQQEGTGCQVTMSTVMLVKRQGE